MRKITCIRDVLFWLWNWTELAVSFTDAFLQYACKGGKFNISHMWPRIANIAQQDQAKNIARVPKVNRVASSGKVPGLFQSMCLLTNQLLLPRVLFAVDLLRCQGIQPASTGPIQFNAFNSDIYTKGASKNQSATTWKLFTNIGNCGTDHTDSYSVSNVFQMYL